MTSARGAVNSGHWVDRPALARCDDLDAQLAIMIVVYPVMLLDAIHGPVVSDRLRPSLRTFDQQITLYTSYLD